MILLRYLRALLHRLLDLPVDMRGGARETRRILTSWDRRGLVELIVELRMGTEPRNWFPEYLIASRDNERLRNLLESDYRTDKELNRALHMADLELKCKRLRGEVRSMQVAAEQHNIRHYATGLIIRCTGCEPGAPANADELTEERVEAVERIARRLRTWWEGHKHRSKFSVP